MQKRGEEGRGEHDVARVCTVLIYDEDDERVVLTLTRSSVSFHTIHSSTKLFPEWKKKERENKSFSFSSNILTEEDILPGLKERNECLLNRIYFLFLYQWNFILHAREREKVNTSMCVYRQTKEVTLIDTVFSL